MLPRCVCVWALLLYNEERRVKCRIAFQCALETSRLKRQQCLCVKVIDILSVCSPSAPPPLSSRFLVLSSPCSLLICAGFSPLIISSQTPLLVTCVSKSVSPVLCCSWFLLTRRRQILRWRWCPQWKRRPSLHPLLRPSHPHLQKGPGASGTPGRPPSSKPCTLTHVTSCT